MKLLLFLIQISVASAFFEQFFGQHQERPQEEAEEQQPEEKSPLYLCPSDGKHVAEPILCACKYGQKCAAGDWYQCIERSTTCEYFGLRPFPGSS